MFENNVLTITSPADKLGDVLLTYRAGESKVVLHTTCWGDHRDGYGGASLDDSSGEEGEGSKTGNSHPSVSLW